MIAIPLFQYTAQGAVIVGEKILEIIAAVVIGAIAGWNAYPKGESKADDSSHYAMNEEATEEKKKKKDIG